MTDEQFCARIMGVYWGLFVLGLIVMFLVLAVQT